MAKFAENSVCGLLIGDLKPTDVASPLSQFQNRRLEKDEFRTLLQGMNSRMDDSLKSEPFDLLFDTFWIKISEKLNQIEQQFTGNEPTEKAEHDVTDMLEEIIFRLRDLEQSRMRSGQLRQLTKSL